MIALALAGFLMAQETYGSDMRAFDVADLCQFVAESLWDEGPGYRGLRAGRVYRSLLFREAGVVPDDNAAAIRAKMQRWWGSHQDRLLCNVPNSIVRNGSILRLAVDRSSTDFINDTVRRWRVDLNYRDPNDGGTVLDFIDSEIRRLTPGNSRISILTNYRVIFETNGGRRARELR